jgi:hypothetical protein
MGGEIAAPISSVHAQRTADGLAVLLRELGRQIAHAMNRGMVG